VIQRRSGPEQSACQQARPYVDTIGRMDRGETTDAGPAAPQLPNASSQLTALAGTAFGDDRAALTDAAGLAGSARAGQPFSAGNLVGEFDGACPFGGFSN
jgi:hypothetical protein